MLGSSIGWAAITYYLLRAIAVSGWVGLGIAYMW
jgi:hypothetical protein